VAHRLEQIVNNIGQAAVPHLVKLLDRTDEPALQLEAAWALSNIASSVSDHVRWVVEAGAVPIFIRLMSSPNTDVAAQSVWGLGNISGDVTVEFRDTVWRYGGFPALLQFGERDDLSLEATRNLIWAISNMTRNKPAPDFALVAPAIPFLLKLWSKPMVAADEDAVANICWTFNFIGDGSEEGLQAVMDSGIVPRIIELISNHRCAKVVSPALRVVGNLTAGTNEQTQYAVENNFISTVSPFLEGARFASMRLLDPNLRVTIRKESVWALSNIAADTVPHIQALIDADVIPKVVSLLHAEENVLICTEAAWVLANIASSGSNQQKRYLMDQKPVEALCKFFKMATEPKHFKVVLEAFEHLLKFGEEESCLKEIRKPINTSGCTEHMKKMTSHSVVSIAQGFKTLLEKYWNGHEEEDNPLEGNDDEQWG
jgi:hypothetical protein